MDVEARLKSLEDAVFERGFSRSFDGAAFDLYLAFGMPAVPTMMLRTMIMNKYMSYAHAGEILEQFGRKSKSDYEILIRAQIAKMRAVLEPKGFEIKTLYNVGFFIEPVEIVRIKQLAKIEDKP